jgi:hypothetical protein
VEQIQRHHVTVHSLLLLDTDALEADGANAEHVDDVARRTAVVERNFIVVFVFGVLVLCCERGG